MAWFWVLENEHSKNRYKISTLQKKFGAKFLSKKIR
jgi:hypothetical protein